MSDWDEEQVRAWDDLYERVAELLARYGTEDSSGNRDYWVNEDNYGWRRVTIIVQNLNMLKPEIVDGLRRLLANLPAWEIAVAVDVVGEGESWPLMGLTIRKHEIIDGLQREYFPEEFRDFQYADSKPGTGFD
jgi:hypothetical protein